MSRLYRPSAWVNVRLRLEATTPEAIQAEADQAKARLKREEVRREARKKKGLNPMGTEIAEAEEAAAAAGAQFSFVFGTTPHKVTYEGNNIRTADALDVTIPWRRVPIDPRQIRAAHVTYYLGTVTADQAAELRGAGIVEGTDSVPGGDGGKAKTRTASVIQAHRDNAIFMGNADDWTADHRDGHWVHFKARDYTAILLDTVVDPTNRLALSGRLDHVIQRFLLTVPAARGLRVWPFARSQPTLDAAAREAHAAFHLPRLDASVIARALQTAASKHRADQLKAKATGDRTPTIGDAIRSQKGAKPESAFDVINDVCRSVGFFAFFDLDRLVIERGGAMFEGGTPGDPRLRGVGFDRNGRTVRAMVFGHNLTSLSMTRRLGRIKVPTIECVSYDPNREPAKRTITARWPVKARPTRASASGSSTEEILSIPVPGIVSETCLKDVARQIYNAKGRQEMVVTMATKDMASFALPDFDVNSDPDLCRLRPGDPIELSVALTTPDGEVIATEMSEVWARASRSESSFRDFLIGQGWDAGVASTIAAHAKLGELTSIFRTRTVRSTFTATAGVDIQIEATNFIEAQRNRTSEGTRPGVPLETLAGSTSPNPFVRPVI